MPAADILTFIASLLVIRSTRKHLREGEGPRDAQAAGLT